MKTIHDWLEEYGKYHQNPTNKTIHEICVPLIMFSVLGLLWCVPLPWAIRGLVHYHTVGYVNFAVIVFILALLYYLRLSWKMAIGMAILSLIMLIIISWLDFHRYSVLGISIVVFILSWIGQFYGHKIEGRKPAFLTDLQFLLIGPAWVLSDLYNKLGISY